MITGEFTEDHQIIITLTLLGAMGQQIEIDAILDTGFSDYLMVSDAVAGQLGCQALDTVLAVTADGRETYLSICEAVLEWNGEERSIPLFTGGKKALLGMALLRDSLDTFEFFPGGLSTIEPAE